MTRRKELEARNSATLEERNGAGTHALTKMVKESEYGELVNKNDKELSNDKIR